MAEYRPRTHSITEEDVSQELGAEEGALTPVPPQISASYVERPAPLSRVAQGINAVQHQESVPQQQFPLQQNLEQHNLMQPQPQTPQQQIPYEPPPPYYLGHGPVQQPPKATNKSENTFKVQCKASYSICTGWKGILEIAARVGVIVSVYT